ISDLVSGCDFRVFTSALEEGGSVRGICAKNSVNVLSRKELDKLTDYIKGIGGKGIAWIRLTGDGVTSSFSRFMTEDEIKAIVEKAGAEEGDVVLIISDGDTSNVLFQL